MKTILAGVYIGIMRKTKYIKVEDIRENSVPGVTVHLPNKIPSFSEIYFEWYPSSITADFHSNRINVGMICSWHHKLEFDQVEYHSDKEIFYFVSGVGIMLFADIVDGKVDMTTVQLERIFPGTELVVDAFKGHFVPVAQNDEPVRIIVVEPEMSAPRIMSKTVICGE